MSSERVPVVVEALVLPSCRAALPVVRERVVQLLEARGGVFRDGPVDYSSDEFLRGALASLVVCDTGACVACACELSQRRALARSRFGRPTCACIRTV
jgi:hypothetical protein